jgi:maltooligosyltrehalose synthase
MSDWLTYSEAAKVLSTNAEAVRQRAIRGRWQRSKGNDGKARVRIPDDLSDRTNPVRTAPASVPVDGVRTGLERLISAHESHIATLKGELAAAHGRASADIAAERACTDAERARADQAIADFARVSMELAELKRASIWRRMFGWRGAGEAVQA